MKIPPINLWSLPDKNWFDHPEKFKQHSRETANKPRAQRTGGIAEKIAKLLR